MFGTEFRNKEFISKTCKQLMQLNLKKKNPIRKMGQRSKWTFVQRRHPGGHRACGKMLNVTNYWRNANQNCAVVSPHTPQHS